MVAAAAAGALRVGSAFLHFERLSAAARGVRGAAALASAALSPRLLGDKPRWPFHFLPANVLYI